ncbi:hypothetical protein Zmor_005794 [Zophobas morio]|uniref:Uncharacterized protein n=1 Tax=Zophobas morio TaxID=2755281 RepID=A0AA38ITU4_9CUCU|nr:hypothetical protein Zmor_005794 [Zophobas morio]
MQDSNDKTCSQKRPDQKVYQKFLRWKEQQDTGEITEMVTMVLKQQNKNFISLAVYSYLRGKLSKLAFTGEPECLQGERRRSESCNPVSPSKG